MMDGWMDGPMRLKLEVWRYFLGPENFEAAQAESFQCIRRPHYRWRNLSHHHKQMPDLEYQRKYKK